MSGYGEHLSACLEAGYHWGPVYDWLDELCEEVTLVHPAKVRLIGESLIKTDKIDSGILAQLLRADLIPEAYASSTEERKVKRLLRQRLFLVGLRTALKNRINNLLAHYDLQKPKVTDLFGLKGMAWLCSLQLPGHDNKVLQADLELLNQLKVHIGRSDNLIADVAAADLAVWWLRSIPGIGKFLSVLIRYEIGRIERFASPKKLASYTGLIPSTRSSGGTTRHGKITRAGNKWLRWALVEAVTPATRASAWIRSYYQGIKMRRGAKDARIATARKLSCLVWHVWSEGRSYARR